LEGWKVRKQKAFATIISYTRTSLIMKFLNCLFLALLILGCSAAQKKNTAKQPDEIRVLTFNVANDGKNVNQPVSQIIKVIKESNANIVCLQEAFLTVKALDELPGWNCARQWPGGAVLTKFKILGTTPKKTGVKIRLNSGKEIFVFNVHLMHAPYQPYQLLKIPYGDGKFIFSEVEAVFEATKARGSQVSALLNEISIVDFDDIPIFISGDFNEPSHLDWTESAAKMKRHPIKVEYPTTFNITRAGFSDAYRTTYPDEIGFSGYTWTPTTKPDNPKDHHDRIDFIFFKGKDVKVKSAEIIGEDKGNADIFITPFPSDHRAVAASFVIY